MQSQALVVSVCFLLQYLLAASQFLEAQPQISEFPEVNLSRPCSFTISGLVRQRLEEELWRPAAEEGLRSWPDGCPFDPNLDLLGGGAAHVNNGSLPEWAGTCLADYCKVFGVCGTTKVPEAADACDAEDLAKSRRRCEDAASKCLPLNGGPTARRLHMHLSQKRCRLLDCRFQGDSAETTSTPLALVSVFFELMIILIACVVVFGVVVAGVELSDEGFVLTLAEKGFVSRGFLKGCVRARDGLRDSFGFERRKGF